MVYSCVIATYQATFDTTEDNNTVKSLEIEMKLKASLVTDTHVGVQQIQSQLAAMHLELQDLKKGKEL